jgi:hypothetical protein
MKVIYINRFKNYACNTPLKIKNVWLKYFKNAREDPSIKFEDFIECSIQLYQADIMSLDIIVDNTYIYQESREKYKINPILIIGNGIKNNMVRSYGTEFLRGNLVQKEASRYWSVDSFLEKADRTFITCGYQSEKKGKCELLLEMSSMYKEGVRSFILKSTTEKTFVKRVDIKDDLSENYFTNKNILKILGEYIYGDFVKKEGSSNTVMLQEYIPMNNEYRFVVINNELKCGAGVVSSHTPLDNDGSDFDLKVLNKKCITEISSNYLKEMMIFATDFVEDLRSSVFKGTYILDIAYNEDSKNFCIIELNPFHNFGLFAMNAKTLLEESLKIKYGENSD